VKRDFIFEPPFQRFKNLSCEPIAMHVTWYVDNPLWIGTDLYLQRVKTPPFRLVTILPPIKENKKGGGANE